MDPEQLRQRALHFRQIANQIRDDRARAAALELAREYEQQAAEAAERSETETILRQTSGAGSGESVRREGT
jgi:hypothetical protein